MTAPAIPSAGGAPADAACAVLVPSCDAYSDLWTPFFSQFWRHWPDCPFPVFLGSNTQRYEDARVTTLLSNQGLNWTNRVREHLEQLRAPYVLMILEDFLMQSPIETSSILECLQAIESTGGHCVRLSPRPAPDDRVVGLPFLGAIRPGSPYRVSTQGAIWRRETLLALMRDGESIWQFELAGSRRSDVFLTGFFGAYRNLLTYRHHVVERGKWFRGAAAKFGALGIGADFTRRPVMSRSETVRWYLRKAKAVAFDLLPACARIRLGRTLGVR